MSAFEVTTGPGVILGQNYFQLFGPALDDLFFKKNCFIKNNREKVPFFILQFLAKSITRSNILNVKIKIKNERKEKEIELLVETNFRSFFFYFYFNIQSVASGYTFCH